MKTKLKYLLLFVLFSISISAMAAGKRVYYVGLNQIEVASADGSFSRLYWGSQILIGSSQNGIVVSAGTELYTLDPTEFLNSVGTPWGSSISNAYSAFKASAPLGSSGGSGGIVDTNVVATRNYVDPKFAGKLNTSTYNTNRTADQNVVAGKEPAITAGSAGQYWRWDKTWQTLNQDAVPDGTNNKAYTVAMRDKLAGIAPGATNVDSTLNVRKTTYNSNRTVDQAATSAALSAANSAQTTANGKQNGVTLTTTGTSGAATFNPSTGALNIPSYAGGGTTADTATYATKAYVNPKFAAKQNTVGLTTTGSGAATFNPTTGALNIPTPVAGGTVDGALSTTSTNAVSNSAVSPAIINNTVRVRRPIGLNMNLPIAISRFGGYNSGYFTTSSATSVTYKYSFTPTTSFFGARFTFGNWELSSDGVIANGTTNPITVRFSFYPALQRGTFIGADSVRINPGATVVSDPFNQIFYAGTAYFLYINVSVAASGQKWPLGIYQLGSTGNEGTSNGDFTTSNGSYTVSTSPGYTPIAIYGAPISSTQTTGSLAIVGTSIAAGRSGDVNDMGWVRRGADAAGISWGRMAVGGGKMTAIVKNSPGNSGGYALTNLMGYDYILAEEGANDLYNFTTLDVGKSAFIAFWKGISATGARVYASTILPRNDWTTDQKAMKNDLNDWLRDGAPMVGGVGVATGTSPAVRLGQVGHPLYGYIEAADIAETSRNSNVWKTNYSSDGVHPTTAGATAISAVVTADKFPAY